MKFNLGKLVKALTGAAKIVQQVKGALKNSGPLPTRWCPIDKSTMVRLASSPSVSTCPLCGYRRDDNDPAPPLEPKPHYEGEI